MTGANLKSKLEGTNLTMKYIAEKMQISAQSLNQIFKSDDVKSGTIEKLCAALGLPWTYFFDQGVNVNDNEDSFNSNSGKTINELTRIIDEQRKRIDFLTDQLLKK